VRACVLSWKNASQNLRGNERVTTLGSDNDLVRTDRTGAVMTLTLNRPDALNAFDRDLATALDAALRVAERESEIRAVIISGAGRAFSAGQDLRELARETAESGPRAVGDQLRNRLNPIVIRIRSLEKPVVAAINGVTTGAGLGIALAADYRIAAESAAFVVSPLGIGLIPAVGSTALLPAILGLGRASELALLGERITADQALAFGLVSRLARNEDLAYEAMTVAERFAALPTKAIGLSKRAFNRSVLPDLAAHLTYEAGLQEVAAETDDHREGLAAILEKRNPTFTGR
jgi:2-(1,2-epoxy-1,2-dihydrophenyl)acetyl-CoA isomerase